MYLELRMDKNNFKEMKAITILLLFLISDTTLYSESISKTVK